MSQQRNKKSAIKRTSRKTKPVSVRCLPLLASEAHLTCKQFRPGTRETCKAEATGFLPTFGDTCQSCARGRRMIRYAITRRAVVEKAA